MPNVKYNLVARMFWLSGKFYASCSIQITKEKKRKMQNLKNKTMTILIALILMLTIIIPLFAIPNANAQAALIMNLPGDEGVVHNVLLGQTNYDIDLNGGPGGGQPIELWAKYPGRSVFTYIGTFTTTGSGDLDYYDFDFNETGTFEFKWVYPAPLVGESNVEIAAVWTLDTFPSGQFQTQAFIGALPNPVGVGQEVLLHVGIQQQLSTVSLGWEGLTVTVTRPDSTTETLGPIRTDSTGATGYVYIPSMVGTYYFQSNYPEQRMPTTAGGIPAITKMLTSSSPQLSLIVQQEPLEYYPGSPLPAEYWTRPINAQHREWYTISASSFMDQENNDAPDSPHILWAKPLTIGGVVGGDMGENSFEHGDAYQGKWSSRFIVAGILIYTHYTSLRPLVYTAVDLRTGELLWEKTFLDNRTISMAQTFFWDSYNYHGVFSYLWVTVGSTWQAFDPYTGERRYSMTNVPSGSTIIGDKGEIYRYNVNLNRGYMTLWNASALGSMAGSWNPSGGFGGNIYGVLNAAATSSAAERAWSWNVTIPTGLPGSVRGVKLGDKVVGSSTTTEEVNVWAFSLKPGQEGQLLYNVNWKPVSWAQNNVTFATYGSSWQRTDMDANVGLIWAKEELTYYAFDLITGRYLWKTEMPHPYLDTYSISARIAYDKVYSVGQSGKLHCWDITNGKLLWMYNATDPYSEFLWGNEWSQDLLFINDGKIYMFHSEHSPVNPLFRGAPAICIDAETGAEVWRVDGMFRKTDWGGSPIMGDSVIAMYNSYDQRVYAIGKGPSATTVTASPKFPMEGGKIMIEGSVTDISPGTQEYAVTARFPNGVPAVSDASQGEWMKYVYAQFARPSDIAGVDVTLTVVDANGNYREIGNATSSSDGFYSLSWTPDIAGEYKVYASFDGSASYFGSHAETVFEVEQTAATPAPMPAEAVPPTDMYILSGVTAIIVTIVIVGIVLLMAIKKRP